jgi:hypothetical protein
MKEQHFNHGRTPLSDAKSGLTGGSPGSIQTRGDETDRAGMALRLLKRLRIASPDSTSLSDATIDWSKAEKAMQSIVPARSQGGLVSRISAMEREDQSTNWAIPPVVDGIQDALVDCLEWQAG